MTPRAWSYGLLFAGILWAALIVAWWLIVAAQTVGVEAWHDSALPQGAFSVVTSRTAPDIAPGQSGVPQGATRDPEPSVGPIATGTPLGDNRGGTPYPSLRAVPRLAAVSRTFAPTGQSMTGTASWYASPANVSAAGPALRAALGSGWRGTVVTVTGPAGSAVTVLGDWMAMDRLVDLDRSIFPAVCGPLSLGLCRAEVSW